MIFLTFVESVTSSWVRFGLSPAEVVSGVGSVSVSSSEVLAHWRSAGQGCRTSIPPPLTSCRPPSVLRGVVPGVPFTLVFPPSCLPSTLLGGSEKHRSHKKGCISGERKRPCNLKLTVPFSPDHQPSVVPMTHYLEKMCITKNSIKESWKWSRPWEVSAAWGLEACFKSQWQTTWAEPATDIGWVFLFPLVKQKKKKKDATRFHKFVGGDHLY